MITINEAEEILKKEYCRDNFIFLLKDVLIPDFVFDLHSLSLTSSLFEKAVSLGSSKILGVDFYEVILKHGFENRRVQITQEMFKILRNMRVNNAIVAFVNNNGENYRLSLLTSKYEYENDKVVKVLSNPRRYSYSLGYNTKTKTAYQFLIAKGKVVSFDDLVSRFSVEVVNRQFYSQISILFTKLVGGERFGATYDRILNFNKKVDSKKYSEFAVRLIGRLMFCWFLKEKKSENNKPLISSYFFNEALSNSKKSYYHETLEPLFFELLNTNIYKRRPAFNSGLFTDVPYLNGGLFSPHVDDFYSFDPSNNCGKIDNLTIPNSWFVEFFSVLNEYNFTVDENTSYDIELSIDPEMLGRIFENLLAEINPETGENAKKSTGSFYTPREIVDYMVDSSLFQYLQDKTFVDKEKLDNLLSYSSDLTSAQLTEHECELIINALYNITILDPACGSGAFPIGMLQKIVYVLEKIDPQAKSWFKKTTEKLSPFLKNEIERKFSTGSLNYIRKLSVIQNSIFGIDIQPIAVEISRLRCFLSLIIEEKIDDSMQNRGINPLPNLDFKFIIANSLVGLDDSCQGSLFDDEEYIIKLKELRDEYFNASAENRSDLKLGFASIQQDMLVNSLGGYSSKKYYQLSSWKPFSNVPTDWFDADWMFGIKDGFDIVIGNPPYIKERDSKETFDLITKTEWGKKWHQGKMDYWFYFAHKAFEILKPDGFLCFIASNYFPQSAGGKKINEYLAKHTTILKYVNFNKIMIFESADVQTMILLVLNSSTTRKGVAFKYGSGDRKLVSDSLANIEQNPLIQKHIINSTLSLLNSNSQLMFESSEESAIISKMDSLYAGKLIKSTQGIVENPNVVNSKNIRLLQKYGPAKQVKVGDEVFVIKSENLSKLNFNKDELKFVKKYHYPGEIKKYLCEDNSDYYLLYLNRYNIMNIDNYPNLKNHLIKFKPIMDERRETKNHSNQWFHLHWPRSEELFNGEKIIYPQMSSEPVFAFSNSPYFVNMSANIIYSTDTRVDLRVLTVILNSKPLKYWLQKTAKKRGANLDISVAVIDRLPINIKLLNDHLLKVLTEKLYTLANSNADIKPIEEEINKRLYEIYNFNESEISIVESLKLK